MSSANTTCRECGARFHNCSSCDNYGEDWRCAYCSEGCAAAAKLEWARQVAAAAGLTPEEAVAIADEVIEADWNPY